MADRTRIPGNLVSELFQDELRQARSKAGLTQEELASRISYSAALVAAIETSRRMPSPDFAERCDEALSTGGLLTRLQARVTQAAAPYWMQEWAGIERDATMLRSWEPLVVPGLLQTVDYARAILCLWPGFTDVETNQQASARMERQTILERTNPPTLFFMIDEGVLHRNFGGPQVMRAQLAKLLELAERPKISLQVIPASVGGHVGLSGPFLVASFDSGPDVAYLDTVVAGQLVEGRDYLCTLTLLFDTLRGEALPCRASSELIRDVMATWN